VKGRACPSPSIDHRRRDREEITLEEEEQVYERLGYQLIPPELRENAVSLEPHAP